MESWGSNIAVNVWWLNEINELVNVSNCNERYDRSMTMNKVTFHKTTEITDPMNPNIVIHALRHGISRMVFRASGSKIVDVEQFVAILSGGRKLNKNSIEILHELYSVLDANGNQKLEIIDLDTELLEDDAKKLMTLGAEWLKDARMYECPLPVDFSNDSYKTIEPFSWKEIETTSNTIDEKAASDSENSEITSSAEDKQSVLSKESPEFDMTLRTSVGERDEL